MGCGALEGPKGEYPSPVPAIAVFPAYHRLGFVTQIPFALLFLLVGNMILKSSTIQE
jgi:hypothetical protein